MKLFAFGFAVTLLSLGLSGCASEVTEETSDTDADSVESELTSGASNYGYFQVLRQDYRKCASPMCGGVFVKRVNQDKTLCADGKLAAECYVSGVQLTGIGLTEDQQVEFRSKLLAGEGIVKARTYKTPNPDGKTFSGIGLLKASEGWLGATGSKPLGTFYRAANNGITCIKAPCPSTSISPLNAPANESSNVIRVDLKSTEKKASSEVLTEANSELYNGPGILLAGNHLLPKCAATATNCGPLAIATEFYLPVRNRIGQSCGGMVIGGSQSCGVGNFCSWKPADICGAADAPGTCQAKPQSCTKIYDPVLGCDGKTYSNSCVAASSGISVASKGGSKN